MRISLVQDRIMKQQERLQEQERLIALQTEEFEQRTKAFDSI
jgi:hypothetical protein